MKTLRHRASLFLLLASCSMPAAAQNTRPSLLPTGERISPHGAELPAGSFPVNIALSPGGKWAVVTDTGFRQILTVISTRTGRTVSRVGANADKTNRLNLYYGLAFAPYTNPLTNARTLYVSCGSLDKIELYTLSSMGRLTDTGKFLADPSANPEAARSAQPNFVAGIALSRNGRYLYAANNESSVYTHFKGSVSVLSVRSRKVVAKVITPGFPYAVTAVTAGPESNRKVYVASEQYGVVSDISVASPARAHLVRNIHTGDHPAALLLNRRQTLLYVANASSDSISVISVRTDRVLHTYSLRGKSGLPGVTPLGLALNPAGTRLYAALADKNAVAVMKTAGDRLILQGYVPAGWYPDAVAAPAGRLMVANAKGAAAHNPNGKKVGPDGRWGQYILNILQGAVQVMPVPKNRQLARLTAQVNRNNRSMAMRALPAAGIKHVIYIIKENRTYDQVLGDMPEGNGDPALCLFGRKVTPNLHALAKRFVLLDNFYCSGEVSPDGWNWSTAGMANEYTERNVPYNYSGRGRSYDFEGETNGAPDRRMGMPDVAMPPGSYLWDDAARSGISYRNYGFFVSFGNAVNPLTGKTVLAGNQPVEPALAGHTDVNFRRFALNYADSSAYQIYHCASPKQVLSFGADNAGCRMQEWLREFHNYVKHHDLPALEMVRLMRDHTSGTEPGLSTPVAMVADNDYAVGTLVQAVSRSPYWKSTLICVLEDDAQDGYDHVDCHRSTAYLISPWIRKNSVDHHFYNTDSMLHTIEAVLHLRPMCRYDAHAPLIQDFSRTPANSAPYRAVPASRSIIAQVNTPASYGAKVSSTLNFSHADMAPPQVLNAIIWHSVKGANVPVPQVMHTLSLAKRTGDR